MRPIRVLCKAEGCKSGAKTQGYCGMHYYRMIRGIPFDAPKRIYRKEDKPKCIACHVSIAKIEDYCLSCYRRRIAKCPTKCLIEDCKRDAHYKGYCKIHFNKFLDQMKFAESLKKDVITEDSVKVWYNQYRVCVFRVNKEQLFQCVLTNIINHRLRLVFTTPACYNTIEEGLQRGKSEVDKLCQSK